MAGLGLAQGAVGLFNGSRNARAANRAAEQQAQAIQQGVDFQKGVYSDAKGNLGTYIDSGKANLGTYQNLLDANVQPEMNYQQQAFDFNKYQDPGATYQAQQAAQAQQAMALAKGATGGGFAKALQVNQNNLANTAYTSAYDRWLKNSQLNYGQAKDSYDRNLAFQQGTLDRYGNLANMGLNASGTLAGAGNQAAGNIGALYGQMGSAQASGTLGAANARSKGLNDLFGGIASGIGAYAGGMSGATNPYAPAQIGYGIG